MPDYNYISEVLSRLTFIDRLALEAAASQIVVLIAAILIEFSARKRRRARPSEHATEQTPEQTTDQAAQGVRPEVVIAEEIASWPTPRDITVCRACLNERAISLAERRC